jgi:uncharacterized protein
LSTALAAGWSHNVLVITDPTFYAVAVPAVLLMGLSKSGFLSGFGALSTAMIALTVPVPQAAAIMLPLLAVMDVTGVQRLWRETDRALLKLLMPAALMGIVVGFVLFRAVSTPTVSGILGVMTLVFLAQRRFKATLSSMQTSSAWARLMAATSGFTSFVAHAGGPPMLAYVLPLKLAPITMTATMAVLFAAINAAKWVPYFFLGLLDWQNLSTSLLLLPIAPLGVWAGVWLTRRVTSAVFYNIADVGMLVVGVKLLWDAWK